MSGRTRPSQAVSPDDARAAARELREAIQDARATVRELRAVHKEIQEEGASAVAQFNALIARMQEHLEEEFRHLNDMTDRMWKTLNTEQARLLGFTGPADMVEEISKKVLDSALPTLVQAVDNALPVIVAGELGKHVELEAITDPRKDGRVTVEFIKG